MASPHLPYYRVLVATLLSDLETFVSNKIEMGYVPVGGVFITVNRSYAQAVWRAR